MPKSVRIVSETGSEERQIITFVLAIGSVRQVCRPAQKAVQANDSEIKDRIAKKVDKAVIDNSDISVEVKDGVVRLSGTVERQTDRLRALTLARDTEGVRSVVDDLQVSVQ